MKLLYKMGLYEEPFLDILNGKKTVEVRLNDEKRRNIKLGDVIEFTRLPDGEGTIVAEVLNIQIFQTFKEMYELIPFEKFGCEGWTMEEMLQGTFEIYTKEQEEMWGTMAITLKFLESTVL